MSELNIEHVNARVETIGEEHDAGMKFFRADHKLQGLDVDEDNDVDAFHLPYTSQLPRKSSAVAVDGE
jgi:hypothetical protein